MMSGMTFSSAYNRIANFYNSNEAFLNNAAQKIASGKQLRRPSDGIADYFRSSGIKRENRVTEMIQRDIVAAQNLLDVADKAGGFVIQDLNKMKDLINDYQNPDATADIRMAMKAQFDATMSKITTMINFAQYGGRQIISDTGAQPLASVMLDPNDVKTRMNISFTSEDVADPTGLDISNAGVNAAFNAVYEKATSYMAKVSAYKIGLGAQANMASNRMINNNVIDDKLSKVDDALAMSVYTDHMVKQQMTVSMMGQAMSGQRSVIDLLK